MEIGQKFNMLTAISFDHKTANSASYWLFKCDCGNFKVIHVHDVVKEKTKSCGCIRKKFMKQAAIQRFTKHGWAAKDHPGREFYIKWQSMRDRCQPRVKNYGLRGIRVSEAWQSFENFRTDMYESFLAFREKFGNNISLDRNDNNLDYSKENCRWATREMQNKHKRNSIMLEFDGRIQNLADWAKEFGMTYEYLYRLVKKQL